jgi:anti-sigma factor RsiW
MSQQCIDPIVGKILAGWRYDISSLAPEMRGDYESHLAGCQRCRSRQQMHRMIDVGLIALASISGAVFLLAFGVIRHFGPRHAFWLEIVALTGFALSALIWLGVAVATPAPVTVLDAAKEGARRVHDRLPEEIRQRLPEELRIKITGT